MPKVKPHKPIPGLKRLRVPPMPKPRPRKATTRADILNAAMDAVDRRPTAYGPPEQNFTRIARRWRVHLLNRFGLDVPIDGASVALMLDDMKSARLEATITHADSWVDKAGYAACGGEVAGSV